MAKFKPAFESPSREETSNILGRTKLGNDPKRCLNVSLNFFSLITSVTFAVCALTYILFNTISPPNLTIQIHIKSSSIFPKISHSFSFLLSLLSFILMKTAVSSPSKDEFFAQNFSKNNTLDDCGYIPRTYPPLTSTCSG